MKLVEALLLRLMDRVAELEDKMAGEFDRVEQNWNEFKQAFTAEVEQVNDKIADLQNEVDKLQADNVPVDRLSALADDIAAGTERMKNLIPDAAPTPEPAPAPDEPA